MPKGRICAFSSCLLPSYALSSFLSAQGCVPADGGQQRPGDKCPVQEPTSLLGRKLQSALSWGRYGIQLQPPPQEGVPDLIHSSLPRSGNVLSAQGSAILFLHPVCALISSSMAL